MKKLLVFLIVIISNYSFSQSVNGTSGLIHIPTASMFDDGQLIIGGSFIPKGFFSSTSGPNKNLKVNPGLNTYLTYAILPWVEVMFRYSHEIGAKVNISTRYFPDRMFSFRARLIKEGNKIPSIVVGFQDVGSLIGAGVNSYFSSNYVVSSKSIKNNGGNLMISLGYAFDLNELKTKEHKGFFGGLSFTPNFYNKISFNLEHNSKVINSGIKWNPFKLINLMIGVWDLNKPTFSFNYQI